MRALHYTDDAKADLVNIALYIADESGNRDIARHFVTRLQGQCHRLAELPGTLGRPRAELREDIRSFPFQGYMIFFRYLDDALEVVNVLHGSRDFEAYFDEAF